jgi:hypothetical protein
MRIPRKLKKKFKKRDEAIRKIDYEMAHFILDHMMANGMTRPRFPAHPLPEVQCSVRFREVPLTEGVSHEGLDNSP